MPLSVFFSLPDPISSLFLSVYEIYFSSGFPSLFNSEMPTHGLHTVHTMYPFDDIWLKKKSNLHFDFVAMNMNKLPLALFFTFHFLKKNYVWAMWFVRVLNVPQTSSAEGWGHCSGGGGVHCKAERWEAQHKNLRRVVSI